MGCTPSVSHQNKQKTIIETQIKTQDSLKFIKSQEAKADTKSSIKSPDTFPKLTTNTKIQQNVYKSKQSHQDKPKILSRKLCNQLKIARFGHRKKEENSLLEEIAHSSDEKLIEKYQQMLHSHHQQEQTLYNKRKFGGSIDLPLQISQSDLDFKDHKIRQFNPNLKTHNNVINIKEYDESNIEETEINFNFQTKDCSIFNNESHQKYNNQKKL